MKKLFLLTVTVAGALSLNAQQAAKSAVQINRDTKVIEKAGRPLHAANTTPSNTANKTTAGSRWYNMVDQIASMPGATIYSRVNTFLMWQRGDMFWSYFDNGTYTPDTMEFCSYSSILDPSSVRFNDDGIPYNVGQIKVGTTDAYTVDSVAVWGSYWRNPGKPGVIDTLRLAFVRNSNIPTYDIWGPGITTNFGTDTISLGLIQYDSVLNRAVRAAATNEQPVIKDIYLNAASEVDTNAQGWNIFSVGLNGFNVNANGLAGVSVSFISGDTYVPYTDTALKYDMADNPTYVYNMFRPAFGKEKATGAITYYPGDFNTGGIQYDPTVGGSWADVYYPSILPAGDFSLEIPMIDWKVTCATCTTIESVGNISNVASVGNVYPNPASQEVTITFTTKEKATLKASLTNTLGQTVKTLDLGKMGANQSGKAVFNVADLSSGVYYFTLEANGQRLTKSVSVTH